MNDQSAAYFVYRTPHGPVTIGVCAGCITHVALGEAEFAGERKPTELSNRAATELLEYFAGKRREFDLPLAPAGTAFQHAVWNELARIPYGQERTSTEVADALGRRSAMRAVGSAVRRNPVEILVPGHRVVSAQGKALGASKASLLRFALLEFERRNL